MRVHVNEECFTEVLVNGKYALFSDVRIDRSSVPADLKMYEVRHDDLDWSEPVEVKRGILINFFGTLISKTELLPENEDCIYIEAEKNWEEIGYLRTKGVNSLLN